MTDRSGPVAHIMTFMGVVAGGIVWLVVYATRVGSIEFNGPASLGMGLGLVGGGLVGGVAGIVYDVRHHEGVIKTLGIFVLAIVASSVIVGAVLGNYAQHKWDYAATHPAECRAVDRYGEHPAACQ